MLKKINSVDFFLSKLMKEASQQEIHDIEIKDGKVSRLSKLDLVHLYQQFCFWNMLKEKHILNIRNLNRLHLMGYEMKESPEQRLNLKHILLRRIQDVNVSLQDLKCYKSSLHAFVELFVLRTVYDSDSVPLELFTEHY